MRQAVAAGEADPGELAYLLDRGGGERRAAADVRHAGEVYGRGQPPLAPLVEPDRVDEPRARAGLPPLAEYTAELERVRAPS